MLRVVVRFAPIFSFAVNVRRGTVGIASALDKLGLQLGMNVGQMNDEDGPVWRLVGARLVVAVEDAHVIRRMVGPELLKVLADHVLAMTCMIQRHLFKEKKDNY